VAGLIGLTLPMLVFDYRACMTTKFKENASNGRAKNLLAAAIDQAVAVIEISGTRSAALFRERLGAGFAMICRVLGQPNLLMRQSLELDQTGNGAWGLAWISVLLSSQTSGGDHVTSE
jgi:hypothetical protein